MKTVHTTMPVQAHPARPLIPALTKQRGATLLEAIAFLGVAAIVTLGAVSMLGSAFSSADVDKATNELSGLRVNIKKLYANNSGYGTEDIMSALIAAKAVPATMTIPATATTPASVTTGSGATVIATGATANFTITYTNTPKDACVQLISNSGGNIWSNVKVGANTITTPVSPATAATNCSNATANTVVFTGA
jgi:hypothetical protein